MYQAQFKNYFDDKLSDLEKKILEQSVLSEKKKNTAPEQQQPGAYHRLSDSEGNTVKEQQINKRPVVNPFSNVINELNDMFAGLNQQQSTNITGQPPQNPHNSITRVESSGV